MLHLDLTTRIEMAKPEFPFVTGLIHKPSGLPAHKYLDEVEPAVAWCVLGTAGYNERDFSCW
jgi:hypothetical protein